MTFVKIIQNLVLTRRLYKYTAFSLPGGDKTAKELTQVWWNYEECYDVFSANTTDLAEQPSKFVPKGAIFLATASCNSLERVGEIPEDTKLVFFPVVNYGRLDYTDDALSNLTACSEGARNTTAFELDVTSSNASTFTVAGYKVAPFAKKNGADLGVFYVFNGDEFFLSACPNDPDHTVCDGCDVNIVPPDGCTLVSDGTLDQYPNWGRWGADTEEWRCGQSRTYNFGATPSGGGCLEVTYTLSTQGCPCNFFTRILQFLFAWFIGLLFPNFAFCDPSV